MVYAYIWQKTYGICRYIYTMHGSYGFDQFFQENHGFLEISSGAFRLKTLGL